MNKLIRAACVLLIVLATGLQPALAENSRRESALMLMANPQLTDPVFNQTVLLTAPLREGARIGIIINRPTDHPMQKLFPNNKVFNQIKEPVYYGGPMLPEVMVLLVRTESDPGQGSLRVGEGLFLALSAPLIEKILKDKPASARCFVGSVLWEAGELDEQIKGGVWSVVRPDNDIIFSRHPRGLWESLLNKSQQQTASL